MNRTAWGGHGRCLAAVAVWLLAACGGGGGDALSPGVGAGSTPSPAASNPSAASAAVTIFSSPSPQEYASVGVSTTDAGDGYEPVSQDARLRNVLFGAADQPRIRYAPGGSYELQLPGMGYDLLVHYKGLANPSSENNFFQPASAQQNYATFIISRSRLEGFQHSELASWTAIPAFGGLMSFGVPTPAAAIPATGRVTYRGRITGMVDVTYWHGLYGGYFFEGVTGDVTVDVDFATRTVLASLALSIDGNTAVTAIGTFSSSPMALAPGVNAFSGLLNTADTGFNQFDALFTGPNADEAIGRFALPVTIGGARHQVMGAWIARKP